MKITPNLACSHYYNDSGTWFTNPSNKELKATSVAIGCGLCASVFNIYNVLGIS